MTIEETKIKRCEMGLFEVVYEGELTLSVKNDEVLYLSASLYADVWGLAITKNSNWRYVTTGEGDDDLEYIEHYDDRAEMSKNSKYRKYFNNLINQIIKIAKSNGEYCD